MACRLVWAHASLRTAYFASSVTTGEAFELPDLRRDWLIRRMRLQVRALQLHHGQGWCPAGVVDLIDVDHIDRGLAYASGFQLAHLLDLIPTSAGIASTLAST